MTDLIRPSQAASCKSILGIKVKLKCRTSWSSKWDACVSTIQRWWEAISKVKFRNRYLEILSPRRFNRRGHFLRQRKSRVGRKRKTNPCWESQRLFWLADFKKVWKGAELNGIGNPYQLTKWVIWHNEDIRSGCYGGNKICIRESFGKR